VFFFRAAGDSDRAQFGQRKAINRTEMAAKDDSDKMRSLREIVRNKFTFDVLKNAGGKTTMANLPQHL
jgi:hypothetical protein